MRFWCLLFFCIVGCFRLSAQEGSDLGLTHIPPQLSNNKESIIKTLSGEFNLDIPIIFDHVMVDSAKDILELIVHKDLVWKHSNGWEQNKAAVLADVGKKVIYYKIKQISSSIITQKEDSVNINRVLQVRGFYETTYFNISLKVEEAWVRGAKNYWQLVNRQVLESVDWEQAVKQMYSEPEK